MEESDFSSGDIILLSGRTPIHLRAAEVTGCAWTQVAVVYRDAVQSQPLVFQATMFPACPDVRHGSVFQGVQLVRISDLSRTFDGGIAVRKLQPALSDAQSMRYSAFVDEVYGRPFCGSKKVSVGAWRRGNKPSDGQSYFCSELVAETYQRLGLIPRPPSGRSANNFIPADFSTTFPGALLPLAAGVFLAEERPLTADPAKAV